MSLPHLVTALLVGASACFAGTSVAAAAGSDASDRAAPERDADRDRTDDEREVPDYDGRGDRTTTGDVLLWGPRVLLAPPYFVTEFVIRRPLGWAIAGAERAGLPAALYDFFAFGPDHKAGFFPTAYLDFGFRPSVGLYTFWDDAGMRGHQLRLRGATGGKEWYTAAFTERFRFGADDDKALTLDASWLRRPDFTFFGFGPDTRQGDLMRYGLDRFEAHGSLEQRFASVGLLRADLSLKSIDFRRGGLGGDERLADAIAAGLPAPAGYTRGYTLFTSGLGASLDQRRAKMLPAGGGFVGARVESAANTRGSTSFVRYGATAGGFVDLNQRGRVLALAVTTRFADPLAGGDVPFSELATLGGMEPMRGFYAGRLTDRSAAVAELSYRWPVWIWLDGTVRSEVGNVFGEHLQGFSTGKLRWSGTIGVESNGSPDGRLEVMVGAGSETFESGGKIDSLRFVIGTTHGL